MPIHIHDGDLLHMHALIKYRARLNQIKLFDFNNDSFETISSINRIKHMDENHAIYAIGFNDNGNRLEFVD